MSSSASCSYGARGMRASRLIDTCRFTFNEPPCVLPGMHFHTPCDVIGRPLEDDIDHRRSCCLGPSVIHVAPFRRLRLSHR